MVDIFVNGNAGRLEAVYQPGQTDESPIVLILHPNPQLGGTMNNKVVYTIFQAFTKMGFAALRFNFRGVGKSQGIYDGDPESELSDTLVVLDWLKNVHPHASAVWVAGYSYGAFVGLSVLMRRPDIDGFVAVSPPADSCDLSYLTPCPANGVIIQGDADTIVKEPSVAVMAERLNASKRVQVDYVLLKDADHLYTNKLKPLYEALLSHVPELLTRKKKSVKKKKL